MIVLRSWMIVILCLAYQVGQNYAADLVIDGEPVAEIILPQQPSPAEIFVATDFQYWVQEMTGGTLPIRKTPSGEPQTVIFVGKSLATQWQADLDALKGTDGFSIRFKGNEVYVFGDLPRGTAYGLYHLLEANTDIIWARPAEEYGTVFSHTDALKLQATDVISKPAFKLRAWNVAGIRGDRATGIWIWRNGGNYADQTKTPELEMISTLGGGHAFFGTMAPPMQKDQTGKTLFERHPEYYSYDETRGGRYPGTLCLTNQELPAVSAANISAKIRALPQPPDYLWLGMRDTWDMCKCEMCESPIQLADGSQLNMKSQNSEQDSVFHSTRYFMFMNKVAAELHKSYPNLKIFTLAYFYAAEPPLCEIDETIIPMFCPVGRKDSRVSLSHPRQNEMWRDRFNEWIRRYGDRMAMYEYYFGVDEPVISHGRTRTSIAQDLIALADAQAIGIYSELLPDINGKFRITLRRSWDANGIDAWIINRLFWNPNQDVTALRDEYLERTYREASPAMKKFYDLLEKSWDNYPAVPKNRGGLYKSMVVDQGIEAGCNAALEEALKLADHPHSKTMIARLKDEWKDYSESLSRNRVPMITADEAAIAANEFDAPVWDHALVFDDFRRPRFWDWGAMRPAEAQTQIRLLSDGANIYVHTTASKLSQGSIQVTAKSKSETWPSADHIELYLENKTGVYLFATDANGNQYDARNYDRRWDSAWRVKSHINEQGWQSLATIPLADIGYKQIEDGNALSIVVIRQAATDNAMEETSLQGSYPEQREKIQLNIQ